MSHVDSEHWESILFKLNDSKRYRRTVGAIASSCIMAATPLLASGRQAACLVALDIVEDGVMPLAKVEEAYRHERAAKEAIEEVIESYSLYYLQDMLDAADEGADENRSTSTSSEDTLAETSNLKVQVSVLNMIAELSRNRSASALEVVLKKVSGLVVGIAINIDSMTPNFLQ
ncbi:hypothetical protein ACE6H2_014122 [Prunus campanulata]